jgi:uncharacterized protein YjiS (DUF1127 family)
MTIQSFATDTLQNGWSFAEAVRSMRERFSANWTARRRYRTVRAELLDYSPRQLAELGISEADVDFVAEDASPS